MTIEITTCYCCSGTELKSRFVYDAPPKGETLFGFDEETYRREIVQCADCGHMLSVCVMDLSPLYAADYVDATYSGDLMSAFNRINALPDEQSDNVARVTRIIAFAENHFPAEKSLRILDVGSGLCVFLHRIKQLTQWDCTALDLDSRQVEHARKAAGVEAIQGTLGSSGLGIYDIITLNKVLEHVEDPNAMLADALQHLNDNGVVYLEVPDAEAAASEGAGREEFFIEHHHIFSKTSTEHVIKQAGLRLNALETLHEPSDKYTIWAIAGAGS